MTSRSLAILVACGILALAGGWYFGTGPESAREGAAEVAATGQLAFPDLAPKLQNAASIEITHAGTAITIEKRSDGRGWGVASLHDYPVQDTKLRGLLTALTELRFVEARTNDPAEFGRIGVDDPTSKTASSDLVQVMDAGHKPIAAMIVGHRKVRARGDLPDQVYVRRPGDNQSWLAEGNLQVDADPQAWLDRNILNIAADRIATVVVGDKALTFGRIEGRFTLTQPADHPKLEEFKVADVARALEMLSFQQVRADADLPGQSPAGQSPTGPPPAGPPMDTEPWHSVFTTSDGLAVAVTVLHPGPAPDTKGADTKSPSGTQAADRPVWVRFSAPKSDAMSDKTKAEADTLNARLAGWTYEIGAWKESSLVPKLADLKAPEPPPPAASSSPTPAAPSSPATTPTGAAPSTASLPANR